MNDDLLMKSFIQACQELHDNQISFYYFVRNGGTDLSGFHPQVKSNYHIGKYYEAREALEASTGQRFTVIPDLVAGN